MTGALIKRELPYEDKGRDQDMLLHAKEHQILPANHQKLEERSETEPPSPNSEETSPADTLILDV